MGGVCGEGGHAWQKGGMHGKGGGERYGRSMRGRYASYWNAFLFKVKISKEEKRS